MAVLVGSTNLRLVPFWGARKWGRGTIWRKPTISSPILYQVMYSDLIVFNWMKGCSCGSSRSTPERALTDGSWFDKLLIRTNPPSIRSHQGSNGLINMLLMAVFPINEAWLVTSNYWSQGHEPTVMLFLVFLLPSFQRWRSWFRLIVRIKMQLQCDCMMPGCGSWHYHPVSLYLPWNAAAAVVTTYRA